MLPALSVWTGRQTSAACKGLCLLRDGSRWLLVLAIEPCVHLQLLSSFGGHLPACLIAAFAAGSLLVVALVQRRARGVLALSWSQGMVLPCRSWW